MLLAKLFQIHSFIAFYCNQIVISFLVIPNKQILREGRIPFDISLNQPNKETIAAMLEAERIAKDPSVKGYNDVEEALRELKR